MKNKIFLPFVFLVTFVVMMGSVASSAHAHNHEEGSQQNDQAALVHEHELEESDLDKEAKAVICCIPNSIKESYLHYIHHTTSTTKCDYYRQRITQCLNCGAVTDGPLEFINSHHPNTH